MRRLAVLLLAVVLTGAGCSGDDGDQAAPAPGATYQPPVHEWPPASTLELAEPMSPLAPSPTTRADAEAYVEHLLRSARYSLRSLWPTAEMRSGCTMCRWVEQQVDAAIDEKVLYRVRPWLSSGMAEVYLLDEVGEARRWGVVTTGAFPSMRKVDADGHRVGIVGGGVPLWAFDVVAENGEWYLLGWDPVEHDPYAATA